MRAAREDARTQTEGDRRHVTKSEQSPNRLEQNQKRPKPELKPVKRYEHLTGLKKRKAPQENLRGQKQSENTLPS